jgi:hypothetical protein
LGGNVDMDCGSVPVDTRHAPGTGGNTATSACRRVYRESSPRMTSTTSPPTQT